MLLVTNRSSAASTEIGAYYRAKRHIPKENVVVVDVSHSDNISPDEYKFGIEEPVRKAIKDCPNAIDFIVLTKGIPIRLRDDGGYSVDGHLAAMNLNVTPIENADIAKGDTSGIPKALNPYFNRSDSFSSKQYNMYLVTRLDGYTVEDAKRLVDASLAAKPERGLFFFDGADGKSGGYAQMQELMKRADDVLRTKGYVSRLDETKAFIAPDEPLMGYVSWGSNDKGFSKTTYQKVKFKPGALAETFVSTSARTFSPVTTGQSVITDLIKSGVTGAKGYVSEPYTFALARPDVLFDRYTSGFNLAESFYAASLVVKWKDVVVGDPLCRPYAPKPRRDGVL